MTSARSHSISPLFASWIAAIAAVAIFSGHALASDNRPLAERLMRPNLDRDVPIEIREFQGGGGVNVREFAGTKAFHTKAFEGKTYETPRFLGIPIPWLASKKVEPAAFSRAEVTFPLGEKTSEFQSSAFEGKEFGAADRHGMRVERAVPVRPARVEGSAQGYHNQFRENLQRDMSLEEVQELLNKPR